MSGAYNLAGFTDIITEDYSTYNVDQSLVLPDGSSAPNAPNWSSYTKDINFVFQKFPPNNLRS